MSKTEFKIGQEVEATEDIVVETLCGRTFNVRKGDKGVINSNGSVKMITGEARGCINQLENVEMKGYDYFNIATRILKVLYRDYNISDFIECEEINSDDIVDSIECELMNIL